jgi:TetR/AcrR family transcriptional regulator, lmrAB and yxaGH operons repressor
VPLMPQRSDSRSRMIQAAVELFRRKGYHATSFSDVVRESGAPRGSIYFHFPGGKDEVLSEAIVAAGDEIEAAVAGAAARAEDAVSFVRVFAQDIADRLEVSGYERGCAIATMVLELAPGDERSSDGFAQVFARCRAALAAQFEHFGLARDRALANADVVMMTLEGAMIVSRAERSPEPFHHTTEALVAIVAADMPRRRSVTPAKKKRAVQSGPRRPSASV